MPWINRPERKTERNTGAARWDHLEVYNKERWKNLRKAYLMQHPLCEACLAKGKSTLATDVHHLTPFSTGKDAQQRQELAFDWNNLQALCRECHKDAHRILRNQKKNER